VGLTAIINKAMAKDPDDRFATPAQLIQALEALPILTGETASGSSDHTLTKPDQWRSAHRWHGMRRWLLATGVVACLLALAGMVLFWVTASVFGPKEQKLPRTKPATQQPRK